MYEQYTDPRAYIKVFFGRYPSFDYRSSEPVMSEFYRMCDMFGWNKDDPERSKARQAFQDALAQQFNVIYGTDVNDLAVWQKFCYVLNLKDIPNELEACRKV